MKTLQPKESLQDTHTHVWTAGGRARIFLKMTLIHFNQGDGLHK
jgi:hypothetical protein